MPSSRRSRARPGGSGRRSTGGSPATRRGIPRNWCGGEQSGDGRALNRFLAHGASVAGLGGAVTFDSIGALHVPPGGASRQITVTVIWQVPATEQPGSTSGNLGTASKLEMTYGMSVVDLQSGKWYVKEIGATPVLLGLLPTASVRAAAVPRQVPCTELTVPCTAKGGGNHEQKEVTYRLVRRSPSGREPGHRHRGGGRGWSQWRDQPTTANRVYATAGLRGGPRSATHLICGRLGTSRFRAVRP